MPIAPSFADLIAQGEAELLARRPDLALNDGDITEADLHASGAMADAVMRYAALAFKETFLDGAEGDALTLLVNDHLGLVREAATAAQVTLLFIRTSGGAGGTIAAGTTVATQHDASGKQVRFTTDTPVVVGAAANGPFSVVATATVTGRNGNADADTVTKIVDTLFDNTFAVDNPDAAAGGNDAESDEELRRRAKSFFLTLRRGTLAALEFGAMQVASVRVATASEDVSTGLVTVLVGDVDGQSTAQMIEDVEFELENWRAAGTSVTVLGASRVIVVLELVLTVRDGFDVAAAAPAIENAVIARGAKQRGGQTLTLDTIISAVIGTFPDDISKVDFTSVTVNGTAQVTPADITATASQVLRITSVTVT